MHILRMKYRYYLYKKNVKIRGKEERRVSTDILLETDNIKKAFGPTKALDGVSIKIGTGEIRGLIGENGSGKSTLSSIVAGVQKADSGAMILEGKPFEPHSMVEAQRRGVSMVIQEMGTIPGISVAENIFVGKEKMFVRRGLVGKKAMNAEAASALAQIGVTGIKPDLPITMLGFEDRKLVEIARAMYEKPKLLIIDETTTALSQRGREIVYKIMRDMKKENRTVLFISHDLEELISVCDCVTVLRDGAVAGKLDKDGLEPDRLRGMMVGRKLTGSYYRSDYDGSCSEESVLELKDVTAGEVLENFSCVLHKGEILGIGGLTDCGMHDLGRAVFGVEKLIAGQVTLCGTGKQILNPKEAIRNKIGYVSKNRDQEAVITSASILDNIALPSMDLLENRFHLIGTGRERQMAERGKETMHIKCNSVGQLIRTLSGGNKQKVVFAKWLENDSEIFILDCPTRGIDIGVKATMYELMYRLKKEGKSMILISEELPELIGMSDRIIILKDGRQTGEFKRDKELDEQKLIPCMI